MIRSLRIQNFQSHDDSTLDFADGVNVIVGTSDAGKTSVIRALRWAITNRPIGDSTRSWWGGDTICTVTLDDGVVTRFKGKEERYEFQHTGQSKTILRAFGANVPADVTDLFNVNEINLQGQLDAPFLLSESPGAVAAHFNKIARLDKIDAATSNVNSWLRDITARKRYKQDEIDSLQNELAQYDFIDKCEAEIEVLETLEAEKVAAANAVRKLTQLLERITTNTQQIDACKTGVLTLEPDVDAAIALVEQRAAKDKASDALYYLIKQCGVVDTDIRKARKTVDLEPLVVPVLADVETRETKRQVISRLGNLMQQITTVEQHIKNTTTQVASLQITFNNEMPETCPLCSQPIVK